MDLSFATTTLRRLDELAAVTDRPGTIHRTFLSPAMVRANVLVGGWMKALGGEVEIDGWGNLIGRFVGSDADAPTLLLGSHLDTVPNAGKFDGPLGVLVALASLEALARHGIRLPFHIDVVGFSDEEGTRFHSAYLGSGALTGLLTDDDLNLRNSDGLTVRETVAAFRGSSRIDLPSPRYASGDLLGYVEVHIEQGPVLEKLGLPLGVVDAIAAQTRLVYIVEGKAGHAGTTPMNLRRDALTGAAEMVLALERLGLQTPGLVATVGQLQVQPCASNVIPDAARFSVDIRHPDRAIADQACAQFAAESQAVAARRSLKVQHKLVQSTDGVICSPHLVEQLASAVEKQQSSVPHLVSGAGHDGILLSRMAPMAMLFVRCREGLSHHPEEHVDLADIDAAINALTRFLENFA
jgi:allantoate deiminase